MGGCSIGLGKEEEVSNEIAGDPETSEVEGEIQTPPNPVSRAIAALCENPDKFLFPVEKNLGYYFDRFLDKQGEGGKKVGAPTLLEVLEEAT